MEKVEEFIDKFESYIISNQPINIWVNYIDLEKITGVDIHEIIKFLESDLSNKYPLISNQNSKWTTRKLYNKYTSVWSKLLDTYNSKFFGDYR